LGLKVRMPGGFFAVLAYFILTGSAWAQVPGGTPTPVNYDTLNIAHGETRIGYYIGSKVYRYQGEYSLTYNFGRLGQSVFYLFGDADVEALSNQDRNFQPDRLTGTFEIGARRVGVPPLTLFLRHQSSHNIDRNDRRQGSWELLGARWNQNLGRAVMSFSAGKYVHRTINDYNWDLDAHATYPLGKLVGRPWEIRGEIRQVIESGPRQQFTDFWIEPDILISPHLRGFLGFGQIHDIDVFGGRTDISVMTGIRIID